MCYLDNNILIVEITFLYNFVEVNFWINGSLSCLLQLRVGTPLVKTFSEVVLPTGNLRWNVLKLLSVGLQSMAVTLVLRR